MNLDAFTLSALVDEFMDVLVGGRIQDVLDTDQTGIGLEIYASHRRHYLYLSADPQSPRVHIVPERLRRGLSKPTQLGLLFRSHVEGGILTHVSQPRWERILQLEVEGPAGAVTIIAEPMERRSNLLLIDDAGMILDCIRRVGPNENRYRVSLPGKPYIPPPPQEGKLEPAQADAAALKGLFEANTDPKRKPAQILSAGIFGVSPLIAREILYRSGWTPDQQTIDFERLSEAVAEVVSPLLRREWQPGIVETESGVAAFSAFHLKHMEGWRPVTSMSEALNAYYTEPSGFDAYKAGKQPVMEAIREAEAKLNARLASLQRSMTDDTERERLRQSGELILAYQYALTQGQTELIAQYDAESEPLTIALEADLAPVENAQRYFDRYNRAKRALDDVPRLIAETEAELAQIRQLAVDLDLAASWPDIDEVQQQLQAGGHWRGPARPRTTAAQKSAPLRIVTESGFVIWVGRNSRQNEQVTFEKAGPFDLWLHARGVPGAHVIIRLEGRQPPEDVIERAASLAAHYSARRSDSRVEVDVTERRHVRKIKGGGPGQVTYRNETTRTAVPRDENA